MNDSTHVIYTLLANGWRWESLGGDYPVLTNAPQHHTMCVPCGRYRLYEEMERGNGKCYDCLRDAHYGRILKEYMN